MNKTKMNGLTAALLITASFTVIADEEYAPSDYRPTVDYSEYRSSSVSAAALEVNTLPSVEHDLVQKSLQNAAPIAAAAIDQAEVVASGASTNADTPVMQNDAFAQTKLMPIIGLATIVGGLALFSRKSAATTSSSVSPSLTEVDSAEASTGVERYLQKIAVSKTGVEKYLERHDKCVPKTGVAKYLTKQVVRSNLKN